MEILLSMRSHTPRTRYNSLFILNLFAIQFIALIALNRLDKFYHKIAQLVLIFANQSQEQSKIPIIVHFGLNVALIIAFVIVFLNKNFKHRQAIIKIIGIVILNFKYVMLIPVGCINIPPLVSSKVEILIKVCCTFNMVITFVLSALELYTNWSNRFREKDYCNRRENSILCLFFQFGFVFSTLAFGSLVGSLFLIAVSIFRAYQVSITVQYPLIQKSTFFYSFLNIYICIICLAGNQTKAIAFEDMTFKLIIGILVGLYFSKNATTFINMWYGNSKCLYKFNLKNNRQENSKETVEFQHENKVSINYKDIIIISRILLSRFRLVQLGELEAVQWDLWWQKYYILLANHKISCNNEKCECRCSNEKQQARIIIQDMRKLTAHLQQIEKTPQIRIMEIYLNIQIANKPLKGYYEIVKMKSEDISATNMVDLESLIVETRECFNRIFVINNIQNSSLPLMKIIRFQELITTLEFEIKMALEASINFMELFTLNSIKIAQILTDSKKIYEIKEKINERLEDLVVNFPDSIFVNFLIFIFYQYLEVYRSKEKQLKIISQQKNLKRRLFEKQDQDIFNPQYGVIYIDLVQERGKIKKITKNVCQLYGHNYQDMISFNINQFMPNLFGKNHHKFLSNFIQMGKIKILADKRRLLFAKNKNKFIFPVIARLRTQHLLNNQFGVTALVKKHMSTSEYIMFSANGKIEEISQKIYKLLFQPSLRTEVDKIRRLCLIKMLPNLLKIINDGSFETNSQKIYESLLTFTQNMDMVEKFRVHRDTKPYGMNPGASGQSSYLSSSIDIQNQAQASQSSMPTGSNYFAQAFKSFLSQLNIVKLNTYNLTYKLSKIKTQQFSVFLLQIISFENCEEAYQLIIQQYKSISEYLSIYQEEGIIEQNFEKYRKMIESNDVVNFVFNKNVINNDKNLNDAFWQVKKGRDKARKKRIMTIINEYDENQHFQTIPSNSDLDNFDDLANGLANQQEFIPRGGSERSSITDQCQSQSKKQMLINAFNSYNCGINRKFLFFINFLIFIMFGILLVLAIKSIQSIQQMSSQEIKNILTLEIKQTYQFRMANTQVQIFYDLLQNRDFNISQLQNSQLQRLKEILNAKFTNILMNFNILNIDSPGKTKASLMDNIEVFDIELMKKTEISILQLLNQLEYIFKNNFDNESWAFLQQNYIQIHEKLEQICLYQHELINKGNQVFNQNQIFIVLGLYELMILIVALSWIPVLYMVSQQQKRILNLLSTMNIKQLRKAAQKLKFLWENIKINKVNQISYVLSMLSDEKLEEAVQLQKQKSLVRNIRLVYENGNYTIKSKFIMILILLFIIGFSILPLAFYANVKTDSNKFLKTLNVIEETYFLADKAPILVNVYLSNINKVYELKPIIDYPSSIYQEVEINYFNLTQYISQAQDLASSLISPGGHSQGFSDHICKEIPCTKPSSQTNPKFYDQIIEIRNKLNILNPRKLNVEFNMTAADIDQWAHQINAEDTLRWVNKIYEFSSLWSTRFKQSIQQILSNTIRTLIILSGVIIPIQIAFIIYIEIKLIKKMAAILKDAESIHMHFPVQVLIQNTYLTSYFNDKIKNNK